MLRVQHAWLRAWPMQLRLRVFRDLTPILGFVSPAARIVFATPEPATSAVSHLDQWRSTHPTGAVIAAPPPAEWPFRYPLIDELPDGPVLILAQAVEQAFINQQTGGTHLVTTQRGYLEQELAAALEKHPDASILMMQDATAGPELSDNQAGRLARAFRAGAPADRLRMCVEALQHGRTAPALVATASVCMEVNDLEGAARDLDQALELAPHWAAAHFERGKLWLRLDDMTRAAEAFRSATSALPGFGPAWANLGATLGELDRPEEAIAAFERALAIDPESHQTLNNIGVVQRELGRLPDSEASFRRVTQLAPELAFGYYNLGHTLFLQGRFQAALSAYAEGQARDPEKNPVQASRLALCKLATGDGAGALRELQRATASLPGEYRQQLLADTSAVLWALVTQQPTLSGWQPVQAWVTGELARKA
jgi:tetratricopeptide (TPR) repeat protein